MNSAFVRMLLARLAERSTFSGLGVLTTMGVLHLSGVQIDSVVTAITAVAGAVLVFLPTGGQATVPPAAKTLMLLAGLGLMLGVGACSSLQTTTDTQNSIAAAEASLTTVEQAALIYTRLPACGSAGATALCSNPALVTQIKAYDNTAYNAVEAVKANAGTIEAALTAIADFRSILPGSSTNTPTPVPAPPAAAHKALQRA